MANEEYLEILNQGVKAWNKWREGKNIKPDLSWEDFSNANLSGANFSNAVLWNTDFSDANLSGAKLDNAYMSGAKLYDANLSNADFRDTDLSGAELYRANLSGANLENADLGEAFFGDANLSGACLKGASLREANLTNANLDHITNWELIKDMSDTNIFGIKNPPKGFIVFAKSIRAIISKEGEGEFAICDLCNAEIERPEGYLFKSYLICEECIKKTDVPDHSLARSKAKDWWEKQKD